MRPFCIYLHLVVIAIHLTSSLLCSQRSVTPSLYHSRLKTYLFYKSSSPHSFNSSFRPAFMDWCPFILSYSVFVFSLFVFSVCAVCKIKLTIASAFECMSITITIRLGFPGHILFLGLCPGVRAGFRKSMVCPGFWPNPQVYLNVADCEGVRRHKAKKAR